MLAAIIDQGNPDRIKSSGISYQLRDINTLYAVTRIIQSLYYAPAGRLI